MSSTFPTHRNGVTVPAVSSTVDRRARSQWLFTPADLLQTPSIVEGLTAAQELANRQKGVNFITQVGIMLKLPQLTLSTASVFLHRYYMRFPMQVPSGKGTHHYQIAATALFLATKVEENCRKMKELIVACCRVAQKNPNAAVDEQSKEYWKWRDTILHHEDMLLEALCFDLQLEPPYRVLFDFLCDYGVQDHKVLRNVSWAFLNDSHMATICLLFSTKTIAGSALYAGIKLAKVTLPDDEQGRPWWEHLQLDILEIQQACNHIADIYENTSLPRQGQKDAYLKDDDIMSFERTRATRSPSVEASPAYSNRSASQGVKREREGSWGHESKNGYGMEYTTSQQSHADQAAPSPKKSRIELPQTEDGPNAERDPQVLGGDGGTSLADSRSNLERGSDATDVANNLSDLSSGSLTSRAAGENGVTPAQRHGEGRERDADREYVQSRLGNHNDVSAYLNGTSADRDARGSRPRELNNDDADYGSEEGEV